MAYPGGKAGAGVYQKIVNLMPPHEVYIEPFLGGGAIMRLKRPARLNIGIDMDPSPVLAISADINVFGDAAGGIATSSEASSFRFHRGDGIRFLERYHFSGCELVYCDPPYMRSTRRSARDLYRFEFTRGQHEALLRVLRGLRCRVMVSGYRSKLYEEQLKGWNCVHFDAMTRRCLATEYLWFNFPAPVALHDYRYLGEDFRARERINRQKRRWIARLRNMPTLQRQALLSAIATIDVSGDAPGVLARNGERIRHRHK